MRPKVYAAGSITGLLYNEAVTWRDKATVLLSPEIEILDPMRGSRYLNNGTPIPAVLAQYDQLPMATPLGILTRDMNDCTTADAILFYFADGVPPSIGSSMEAGWGRLLNIPMVGVASPDNVHRVHPMFGPCVIWVETLEDGCAVIRSLLNR